MSKILIVDDNRLDLEVIGEYLRPLECSLLQAADGFEALILAEREAPDLVLLDILIPGPDGIRILRELKDGAKGEYLPVLLMTAVTSAEYRRAGLESGADAFLQKPLNPLELLPIVRNFLGLRQRFRSMVRERDRLERAQELRQALSNLLVFDLRNPIAVIESNLQFLAQELSGAADPEWIAAVSESRAATRNLLRMIANILDTTRLEEGHYSLDLAEVDVSALLGDVARRIAGEPVRVRSESPGLSVLGDRSLLERIVENLVDTAIRFAPPQVEIALGCEPVASGRVRFQVHAPQTTLPAEVRAHLFQRFHRIGLHVSPSARHAALALYFCKLAALAHKGEVGVAVTPEGTTFSAIVPSRPPTG
jgi:DNA-binding response OmpR family regulator